MDSSALYSFIWVLATSFFPVSHSTVETRSLFRGRGWTCAQKDSHYARKQEHFSRDAMGAYLPQGQENLGQQVTEALAPCPANQPVYLCSWCTHTEIQVTGKRAGGGRRQLLPTPACLSACFCPQSACHLALGDFSDTVRECLNGPERSFLDILIYSV